MKLSSGPEIKSLLLSYGYGGRWEIVRKTGDKKQKKRKKESKAHVSHDQNL